MKICNCCVLDERFPGIRFAENGTCNYCNKIVKAGDNAEDALDYRKQFEELIARYRNKSGYDCVVAYSGGKDSTYLLHLLKNEFGLRILAFSYDNWFQSEAAQKNISSVLENLSVDHLTIRPAFETMCDVIKESVDGSKFSPKALTRASSICTTCISLIRVLGLRLTLTWNAPFYAMGMSPGQSSIATAIVKTNSKMIKTAQAMLFRTLSKDVIDKLRPLTLEEKHFRDDVEFPYSINPLSFIAYDERNIYQTITKLGWSKPLDTDANSTNCLLNAFANQVHVDQFGYNPYASEISELVRTNRISRDEGLERLNRPFPQDQIALAKKQLGLHKACE